RCRVRHPLVMTIQNMAVARYQNGSLATESALCKVLDLLQRKLRLSRLQVVWIDFLDRRSFDTPALQEVDKRASMLALDLRHIGARDPKRTHLLWKINPLG